MKSKDIKVVDWISLEDGGTTISLGGLGGFFENGMRWDNYIEIVKDSPHLTALREEIIRKGLKENGGWHQYNEAGVPLFSDGSIASYSMRGWGDLLAAIWSTEESTDYNYMDFYC